MNAAPAPTLVTVPQCTDVVNKLRGAENGVFQEFQNRNESEYDRSGDPRCRPYLLENVCYARALPYASSAGVTTAAFTGR